ncbi:e3 ubiquitin-protein ligase rnf213 [Anaeramoeba ignava]|uniref:E3 ubiquitin-protein ligase rnf213 n=1 Tax=Anaeramoeba ignava TaxID=1746090 RepID=A0A9Q0RAD2_ANAIG|nr:e3 ubiquitin-protein ligase rnf213 [Anaeramoeba ignava]
MTQNQIPVTLITIKKGKPKLQYQDSNQETKEIGQDFESNHVYIFQFPILEQEKPSYRLYLENKKEKKKEFTQIDIKESKIIFDFDEKDSKKYGTRVIDAVIDYSSPSEKKILKKDQLIIFTDFLNAFSKKRFETKQSSKVTFKSKPENIAKILFVLGLRYSKSTLKKIFKESKKDDLIKCNKQIIQFYQTKEDPDAFNILTNFLSELNQNYKESKKIIFLPLFITFKKEFTNPNSIQQKDLGILFSFYAKYHFKLSELSKPVLIDIFGKSLNFQNTIWFNFINTIQKKELMINLFLIPNFQDNLKNTIFPNLLECFQFWVNLYNFANSAEMRKIRNLRSAIMQIASILPDIAGHSLFNQPCLKNEKRTYIEKLSDLITIFEDKSYHEYSNKQIKNNDERLEFFDKLDEKAKEFYLLDLTYDFQNVSKKQFLRFLPIKIQLESWSEHLLNERKKLEDSPFNEIIKNKEGLPKRWMNIIIIFLQFNNSNPKNNLLYPKNPNSNEINLAHDLKEKLEKYQEEIYNYFIKLQNPKQATINNLKNFQDNEKNLKKKILWFSIILYSISFLYKEKLTKNIESQENKDLSIGKILSDVKIEWEKWIENLNKDPNLEYINTEFPIAKEEYLDKDYTEFQTYNEQNKSEKKQFITKEIQKNRIQEFFEFRKIINRINPFIKFCEIFIQNKDDKELSNIKNLEQNWQQNKLSEITNLKQSIEKTLKVNIQILDLINDLFPNQDEKDQTIIEWIKEELKEKTIDNLKTNIQNQDITNDDDLNQTKKYLINFIDIFNPFFTKTFQNFDSVTEKISKIQKEMEENIKKINLKLLVKNFPLFKEQNIKELSDTLSDKIEKIFKNGSKIIFRLEEPIFQCQIKQEKEILNFEDFISMWRVALNKKNKSQNRAINENPTEDKEYSFFFRQFEILFETIQSINTYLEKFIPIKYYKQIPGINKEIEIKEDDNTYSEKMEELKQNINQALKNWEEDSKNISKEKLSGILSTNQLLLVSTPLLNIQEKNKVIYPILKLIFGKGRSDPQEILNSIISQQSDNWKNSSTGFFNLIKNNFTWSKIKNSLKKIKIKSRTNLSNELIKQINKRDGNISNPKIFIKEVKQIHLFTMKEQVLFCDSNTNVGDVKNFFSIYKYYNEEYSNFKKQKQKEEEKVIFSIINATLLSQTCQNEVISQIRSINFTTHFPLTIFVLEGEQNAFLMSQLQEGKLIINLENDKILNKIIQKSTFFHHFKVFYSQNEGDGKSYQIRKFCNSQNDKIDYKYYLIQLTTGEIQELIVELNKIPIEKKNENEELFIHIEFPTECSLQMTDSLWQLSMWGSIEDRQAKDPYNICWTLPPNAKLFFEIPSQNNIWKYFYPLQKFQPQECSCSVNEIKFKMYEVDEDQKKIQEIDDNDLKKVANLLIETQNNTLFNNFKDFDNWKQELSSQNPDTNSFFNKSQHIIQIISEQLNPDHNFHKSFRLFYQFWNSLKKFINPILDWEISDQNQNSNQNKNQNLNQNPFLRRQEIIRCWIFSVARLNLISFFSKQGKTFDNFYSFILNLEFENGNPVSIHNPNISGSTKEVGLFMNTNFPDNFLDFEGNLYSISQGRFGDPISNNLSNSEREYKQISEFFNFLNPNKSEEIFSNGIDTRKGKYVLTFDNLSKMMFIQFRMFTGFSLIISGETGCGKTALIEYLFRDILNYQFSKFNSEEELNEKEKEKETNHFITFNVNGGTTKEKIKKLLEKSKNWKTKSSKKIPSNIKFIAAINPYRERKSKAISENQNNENQNNENQNNENQNKEEKVCGLLFDYGDKKNKEQEEIRNAVYRVHKIPNSLENSVLSFESLNSAQEQVYISKMVDNTFYSILNNNDEKFREYQTIISSFKEYISKSHSYIRQDGDSNQTNDDFKRNLAALISLRDVSRILRVFQWLVESKAGIFLLSEKENEQEEEEDLFQKAIYLSLFICYASRQTTSKDQYFEAIFERNNNLLGNCKNVIENSQEKLIESLEDYDFSKKMIAKNIPLKENCLLIFVCVYAQIPLFIIGKPGTSKSISVEVIMESLKPPHEINNFAKKLELRTLRESFLQCSPITTTQGIEDVFKIAKSKTKKNDLGVVILDEVALAELSPDLPLKALHSQLEESEKEISRINQDNKKIQDIIKENGGVSVVAISNWVLDPSNTNRGILLRRESITQLGATSQQILCTKISWNEFNDS